MRNLIIIPTYNEIENIEKMLSALMALNQDIDVLVVDDGSPDGTGRRVRELGSSNPHINLLERTHKQGLGKAYIAGFNWGLERGYDALVEMDADFSHRPEDLVKILEQIKSSDFVVGSRYVSGGGTVNWSLSRKLISRGGSFYSRTILGYPLNDWTGGFNAWRKEVLQGINLQQVKSEGYSFQIELKYRAQKKGFKGVEVPILFADRKVGQSKMSMKIVVEAFYRVWVMRFGKH